MVMLGQFFRVPQHFEVSHDTLESGVMGDVTSLTPGFNPVGISYINLRLSGVMHSAMEQVLT